MDDATPDLAILPSGPRARVGSVLHDKWRIDALLGVGGMAAVYAATHRTGGRVAIKVLHPEYARDGDMKARFLREGYLANAVEHDGVVSILDDGTTPEGAVFLVMELLEGETVEGRWKRNGERLPARETLAIASAVLEVLAAAHAKGIVHRDIKPENLFLTQDGRLKILDFGIAGLRRERRSDPSNGTPRQASSSSLTQTGVTMGTPAFMSPEQARGRWDEVDPRSDLWAVGATMFALLSGEFVHDAATPNERLLAAMTQGARPLRAVVVDIDPAIAALVDRALQPAREDRWPDARAMQAAIWAAHGGGSAGRAAPPLVVPRGSSPDPSALSNAPSGAASPATMNPSVSPSGPLARSVVGQSRPRSRFPVVFGATSALVVAALLVATFLPRQTHARSSDSTGSDSLAQGAPLPGAGPLDVGARAEIRATSAEVTHQASSTPTIVVVPPPSPPIAPAASAHPVRHPPAVAGRRRHPDAADAVAAPISENAGLLDRRH